MRGIAAGLLVKYSGLTQRQVANLLNVRSGSTVSKQIVRSRKMVEDNDGLSSRLEKCNDVLREMRRTE